MSIKIPMIFFLQKHKSPFQNFSFFFFFFSIPKFIWNLKDPEYPKQSLKRTKLENSHILISELNKVTVISLVLV